MDMKERVSEMLDGERPLLDTYQSIARQAASDIERRLAEQMIKAQRFQISTLELILEGRVPEQFHCFGAVTHEDVSVRGGPSPRQDTVRRIDRGLPVIVKEYQGNWAHIQLPDGESGWVFRDYVQCELTG
ncbi:MAG: SH3 domain-containing protein [Thermaerobacterales bacterium]